MGSNKGNLECVCARSGVCKEESQDLCERERVRRLTKKMRAEVLQSRDTGDDGEGSGVDFGGEDLKETMDPKPEPL